MAMGKDQIIKAIITFVPRGRMGTPDEVASAVLFVSRVLDSSFVAGTDLLVDGGMAQI
jgi:NAD(P)-dependent dehydrogenase (short-subunit alcohol dehydrogenase family)